MLDDQSRSDTYPYIDIQEDDTTMTHEATVGKVSADQVFYLMSRGLTENEATNLIVQGFLEVFTKELPDGVRDRVQPAREARDGGVARMTAPTGEAAPTEGSAPAPRQRPVRRALDDLGLIVTAEHVEQIAADEPAWLADDRRAAFERYDGAAGRVEPSLHAVHRPAGRPAGRRRARDRRSGDGGTERADRGRRRPRRARRGTRRRDRAVRCGAPVPASPFASSTPTSTRCATCSTPPRRAARRRQVRPAHPGRVDAGRC